MSRRLTCIFCVINASPRKASRVWSPVEDATALRRLLLFSLLQWHSGGLAGRTSSQWTCHARRPGFPRSRLSIFWTQVGAVSCRAREKLQSRWVYKGLRRPFITGVSTTSTIKILALLQQLTLRACLIAYPPPFTPILHSTPVPRLPPQACRKAVFNTPMIRWPPLA
jgi:hypothetical protein